jgi:hypothetical protein
MMAARGQTYGKRKQQEEAQRAVPMRQAPTDVAANRPIPSAPGSLVAPTQRPQEPITAGAPFGEGPGPEALPFPVAPAVGDRVDLAMRVRAIASQFPNAALLGLLAELEA